MKLKFDIFRGHTLKIAFGITMLAIVIASAGVVSAETLTIASGTTTLEFQSTQYDYSGTAVRTYASSWGDLIPGASWVWSEYPQSPDHLANGDIVSFWTNFQLLPFDQTTVNGEIQITADDGYTIYINDQYVGDSGYPNPYHDDINAPGQWQWEYVRSFNVAPFVHEGVNTLRIDAWNGKWGQAYATSNPAGLLLKMEITYIPITEVSIDIKPGNFPNSINLGSGGTVPVAILSTLNFDATTVDSTTVTLASAPVKLKGQGTPMASFQDVNGDGLMDMVVHISTQTLQLSNTDTEAILEGQTFSGTFIRGKDLVRIVP